MTTQASSGSRSTYGAMSLRKFAPNWKLPARILLVGALVSRRFRTPTGSSLRSAPSRQSTVRFSVMLPESVPERAGAAVGRGGDQQHGGDPELQHRRAVLRRRFPRKDLPKSPRQTKHLLVSDHAAMAYPRNPRKRRRRPG